MNKVVHAFVFLLDWDASAQDVGKGILLVNPHKISERIVGIKPIAEGGQFGGRVATEILLSKVQLLVKVLLLEFVFVLLDSVHHAHALGSLGWNLDRVFLGSLCVLRGGSRFENCFQVEFSSG